MNVRRWRRQDSGNLTPGTNKEAKQGNSKIERDGATGRMEYTSRMEKAWVKSLPVWERLAKLSKGINNGGI